MLELNDQRLFRQQCYIDGRWCDADDGGSEEITNPADGEVIGTVPVMGAAETQRAIAAADAALPGWRSLTAGEKAGVLRRWHELMLEHKEDLKTGTAAAALGGVTAIFEMPNTKPSTTNREAMEDKLARARGRTWVDHAFFVGAAAENAEQLGELQLQRHGLRFVGKGHDAEDSQAVGPRDPLRPADEDRDRPPATRIGVVALLRGGDPREQRDRETRTQRLAPGAGRWCSTAWPHPPLSVTCRN